MLLLGKSRDPRLTILNILVEYETNQDLIKLFIKQQFKQYLMKDRELSRVAIYLAYVSARIFFHFWSGKSETNLMFETL